MALKKVVVNGGGQNLYRINSINGKYTASHVISDFPFGNTISVIGEARSMEDALSLIKSHSGQSIKKITDW